MAPSFQCRPTNVATLGRIAKKKPFQIDLKLAAMALNLSCLRHTEKNLEMIVNTNSSKPTSIYPERLKIRLELKPY